MPEKSGFAVKTERLIHTSWWSSVALTAAKTITRHRLFTLVITLMQMKFWQMVLQWNKANLPWVKIRWSPSWHGMATTSKMRLQSMNVWLKKTFIRLFTSKNMNQRRVIRNSDLKKWLAKFLTLVKTHWRTSMNSGLFVSVPKLRMATFWSAR